MNEISIHNDTDGDDEYEDYEDDLEYESDKETLHKPISRWIPAGSRLFSA